ncbi:hypothetical protein M8J76_001853 [Diaphorina citri]|nr:hypothetical protein M8J76_001853 [Diaphorina citri]
MFLPISYGSQAPRVLIYVPRKSRQVHHHHHHQPLVVLVDPRLPPPSHAPQHYHSHYPGPSVFRQRIEVAPSMHHGAAAPVIHHHHGPIISPVGLYKAAKGEYHSPHEYDSHEHHSTAPGADYGYAGEYDHRESMSYPRIINIGTSGIGPSGPGGHHTRIRSRLVYL